MIDSEIHGEIGQIMFDYQWNEMVRGYGLAQFTAPVYDKKLWPDNGYFEAPTLRGITSIVCDIAGSVTGQSWWLGLVDDAVFAALDLGIENKDPTQVALGFAKAAAINTMSFGVGAAGKAVTAAASTIANTALRVGAQAAWSMGSSYISSVGAGFINAFDYSDGNVTYNWDKATKSLYSSDTITGALSAGISTGISYSLNFSINNKLRTMDNGAEINKIYGGAINLGVSAASKLGEYSVYAAYALSQGRTLQDAFDDMGGISINVLSLGSMADIIANTVSRTNGTGQSKLVKLADSLRGTGILELNFGSKGISARIGTGGIDVGSNLYDLVKRQSDKNAIQNYAKTAGKDKYETVWNNYIYGDTVQENTSARIAYGKDELYFINNGPRGETISNGKGGRKIFIKDYGDKYQNALTLGHESYRDGIKGNEVEQFCETVEAVKAHTEMAQRMLGYNVSPGVQAIKELIYTKELNSSEFMEYVAKNYDVSDDYWKVLNNGNIVFDGDTVLRDENGVVISREGKGKGYLASLAIYLGLFKDDGITPDSEAANELLKNNGYSWNAELKTYTVKNIDVKDSDEFQIKVPKKVLQNENQSCNNENAQEKESVFKQSKKENVFNFNEASQKVKSVILNGLNKIKDFIFNKNEKADEVVKVDEEIKEEIKEEVQEVVKDGRKVVTSEKDKYYFNQKKLQEFMNSNQEIKREIKSDYSCHISSECVLYRLEGYEDDEIAEGLRKSLDNNYILYDGSMKHEDKFGVTFGENSNKDFYLGYVYDKNNGYKQITAKSFEEANNQNEYKYAIIVWADGIDKDNSTGRRHYTAYDIQNRTEYDVWPGGIETLNYRNDDGTYSYLFTEKHLIEIRYIGRYEKK